MLSPLFISCLPHIPYYEKASPTPLLLLIIILHIKLGKKGALRITKSDRLIGFQPLLFTSRQPTVKNY